MKVMRFWIFLMVFGLAALVAFANRGIAYDAGVTTKTGKIGSGSTGQKRTVPASTEQKSVPSVSHS